MNETINKLRWWFLEKESSTLDTIIIMFTVSLLFSFLVFKFL